MNVYRGMGKLNLPTGSQALIVPKETDAKNFLYAIPYTQNELLVANSQDLRTMAYNRLSFAKQVCRGKMLRHKTNSVQRQELSQ